MSTIVDAWRTRRDIRRDNPRREIGGWSITSEIEQETIRAVVLAYAEGKIELPRLPGPKARGVRYAPSFRIDVVPNGLRDKPYTAESIAKFLGWMSGRSITAAITRRRLTEVDGGLAIG